jgi:hypothetical protein
VSRCALVVEQAEYDMWCNRNAHVFKSVESDVSELSRCKSLLRVASGGNPLLLESFRAKFQSTVSTHSFCLFDSNIGKNLNRHNIFFAVSQVSGGSFASCFDLWFEFHEIAAFSQIRQFILANKSDSTDDSLPGALLSCLSVGPLEVCSEFYDHRHMFRVPEGNQECVAAFIASPYLPVDRFAMESLAGHGVCSSGISNAAAAKLLRTTLRAGVLLSISFKITLAALALILVDVMADVFDFRRESFLGV